MTIRPDPSGLLYQDELTSELYPVENPLPKLRSKSRAIFECKDSAGTVIFSDITPIHGSDSLQFTGYLWIKEDPMRTYNSIQEGSGRLYIVGQTYTNDPNWLTKYNVRSYINININLTNQITNDDGTNQLYYVENTSPIIFRDVSNIQSGSGLFVSESMINNTSGNEQSTLVISASNLQTYSGKVNSVQLQYWLSGSGISGDLSTDSWVDFSPALSYILNGNIFEDGIHSDYSRGINPMSEEWFHEISQTNIPHGSVTTTNNGDSITGNRVKLKFRFFDINGNPAIDVVPSSASAADPGEVQIYYPSGNPMHPNYVDSDDNWLVMQGSSVTLSGTTTFSNPNKDFIVTAAGQFPFGSAMMHSTPRGVGLQYQDKKPKAKLKIRSKYVN